MKKCQRRGLGNISNNEINNLGSGAGGGRIDVEAEDQASKDMKTAENMEHNEGLFELDGKESKDLNAQMLWKV